MKSWLEAARERPWWQLLLAAIVAGSISGPVVALLGVFASEAIHNYLAHDKLTEWEDALLAIYAFLTFGATGFVAGFSIIYGLARRSWHRPLAITCATLAINILGLFTPTGGYAMLPFYISIVAGAGLTIAFLA